VCDSNTASGTCGQCLCDTTCGGVGGADGCLTGWVCNSDTGSPACGQCSCDTTCGLQPDEWCAPPMTCDKSQYSPTCGNCVYPPDCGGCPSGSTCDPYTLQCVSTGGE
jgi:hypothetical protein